MDGLEIQITRQKINLPDNHLAQEDGGWLRDHSKRYKLVQKCTGRDVTKSWPEWNKRARKKIPDDSIVKYLPLLHGTQQKSKQQHIWSAISTSMSQPRSKEKEGNPWENKKEKIAYEMEKREITSTWTQATNQCCSQTAKPKTNTLSKHKS